MVLPKAGGEWPYASKDLLVSNNADNEKIIPRIARIVGDIYVLWL